MPLLMNSSVGSSFTTIGAEGTMWWPLEAKKSRNCWRTAEAVGSDINRMGYAARIAANAVFIGTFRLKSKGSHMPYKERSIEKQYFTIGEVAAQFKVAESLVRFWETEFDELRPRRS